MNPHTIVWLEELRTRARRAAQDGTKVKLSPGTLERLISIASSSAANEDAAEALRVELRTLRACWDKQQGQIHAIERKVSTVVETLPKLARVANPFDGGNNG